MIKVVIMGVAAFLVGLLGSTGVLVLTAPARPPGADSLMAARHDSTATRVDSVRFAKPGAAPVATLVAPAPAPAPAQAPAQGPAATVPATPASHTSVVTKVPAGPVSGPAMLVPSLPDAESYKQVGGILLNMKPVEAAKIIGYLSDDQVEGLLRTMSPRNAATVLSQLPAERAAAISRRLLLPAPKETRP